jgi:two-component system, LuxR family, response regulator FixJ
VSEPVEVHVIDDDAALRDSLVFLLTSAGLSVRAFDSAEAFLAAGVDNGCVLTDVRMPGVSGVDLLRRLRAAGSRLPVIVMTGHGDVALAVEAMKLGAADFLEKPFSDDALLSAVDTALAPRGASSDQTWARKLSELSQRERQVLEGLIEGKANKDIARELEISPRTIEIYRAKVMAKMGAGSFAELVRMAVAGGLARGIGDG